MKKIVLVTGKRLYRSFSRQETAIDQFALLIKGNSILWAGPEKEVPSINPDKTINLGEATVIPGLMDMHVHLFLNPQGESDTSPHHQDQPSAFTERVLQGWRRAQDLLSQGITTCRDLGAGDALNTGLRDAVSRGLCTGPRIFSSGEAIAVTGGHGSSLAHACDGPWAMVKEVRRLSAQKVDWVKLMVTGGVNSPGPEAGPMEFTREEIRAAIQTAKAHGLKVAVHTHGNTGIRTCVEEGAASIEHGVFLTEDLFPQMLEKGIFLIPTLSPPFHASQQGLQNNPDDPDHNKSAQVIEKHRKIMLAAHRAGVPLAVGSDAGTPYNHHNTATEELLLMQEAGMSPRDILFAATMGGAALIGQEEKLGSLQKGKLADFVAIEGDPIKNLSNIRRVSQVWKDGIRQNFFFQDDA